MAKKALLIGINRYKVPGADLRGCVNDVKNMQDVLTRYYGFSAGDITTLVGSRAPPSPRRERETSRPSRAAS